MTRITPRDRSELTDLERSFAVTEQTLGFLPTSVLTMAHRPRMAELFNDLAMEVFGPGTVDLGLKGLVAQVASYTAGCRYCQAHSAALANLGGGESVQKVQAAFDPNAADLFSDRERAAIELAQAAAAVPNTANDGLFERLKLYFTDEQIVELLGVIAVMGFLNRWNDTMATTLEPQALHWAQDNIAQGGWEPGSHAPDLLESR